MHIIFFQNCVSPHQMPYIEALAERTEVGGIRVIAPRFTYEERAAMGWDDQNDSKTPKLKIAIDPSDADVKQWLKEDITADHDSGEHTVCLFSGINAFPEVFHWLTLTRKLDVQRGDITEAPYLFDHPLWMHKLRFFFKDLWHVRKFSWVFAIGEGCKEYYEGWSSRWKVIPFMYCTRPITPELQAEIDRTMPANEREAQTCRIAFVGSIDDRKHIITLLDALNQMALENAAALSRCQVTVVGDGPLKEDLLWKLREDGLTTNVSFVGTKPMEETQRILAAQDFLVLPSLHDGWGAVVNEAMTLGVWPLVSDKCGVRQLIEEDKNGNVFPVGDAPSLCALLDKSIKNLPKIRAKRPDRIQWAKDHISPTAVADIMLKAIKS